MPRELPRDLGPYRLLEKLGAGGMGVVYRGIDTTLNRPVAIKMMLGLDQLGDDVDKDEVGERFLREARAAALIQSRSVAQVLQLGTSDEGEPYIVMELLKGLPLSKVMSRSQRAGGPMPPERVVHIARQICRGMQAAHDLGIVHRDLKPANIMLVSEDGDDDTVKILDFGVAKLTNEERTRGLTQAGAMLGTLAYMSPEQVAGSDVDARSDIYALGVILYRMFTGVSIWDADSLSDIVRHQLESRPPSMLERITNATFPVELDAVVLRCLEKKPDRRFASMRELGDALQQALLGPRLSEVVADVVDSTVPVRAPTPPVISGEGGTAVFASAATASFAAGATLPEESEPTAATAPLLAATRQDRPVGVSASGEGPVASSSPPGRRAPVVGIAAAVTVVAVLVAGVLLALNQQGTAVAVAAPSPPAPPVTPPPTSPPLSTSPPLPPAPPAVVAPPVPETGPEQPPEVVVGAEAVVAPPPDPPAPVAAPPPAPSPPVAAPPSPPPPTTTTPTTTKKPPAPPSPPAPRSPFKRVRTQEKP